MTLVTLKGVCKQFAGVQILKHINLTLAANYKIGLVGRNGSGKSTLLALIYGSLEPDSGEIFRQRAIRIRLLPQIPVFDSQATVLDYALTAFEDLRQIEQQLEVIAHELEVAQGERMQLLIKQQDELLDTYQREGGYQYQKRAQTVLHGLGFSAEQMTVMVEKLSGGEKCRLALAHLLLSPADLLLLDEPTNFLDLDATEWLENELKQLERGMLIVSHDRYLLDKLTTQTWELDQGSLHCYQGNYSAYLPQKAAQQLAQRKLYEQQQAEIARQEEFIRRNLFGQKSRQAQSRRKMLAKIERLAPPSTEKANMGLYGKPARRSGEVVLQVQGLGHAFGNRRLFQELNLTVYREEKLAIVGPNGCGKSTLLHLLVGELTPSWGHCQWGAKIDLAFYHQEHAELDLAATVFESVKQQVPTMDDGPLRSYLARFLFCGDDIHKVVGSLSGGEQSKVALAKLLVLRPNVLVLDEPTNHLDIPSRQALEEFLAVYSGTIIFVSHDRYFIDRLAGRLLVFDQGQWRDYPGNYSHYLAQRTAVNQRKPARPKKKSVPARSRARSRPKRRYTFAQLEEQIIQTEEKLEIIAQELAQETTYQQPRRVQDLKQEYEQLKAQLSSLNAEWETWAEEQ